MSWTVWNMLAHLPKVDTGKRWTKVAIEWSVTHSSQQRLCTEKHLLGKQISLGKASMSIVFFLSYWKDKVPKFMFLSAFQESACQEAMGLRLIARKREGKHSSVSAV